MPPRGPQSGLAQGPSLLSDLDKPCPPPLCPVPSGAKRVEQNLSSQTSSHFSSLGSMLKCRCPGPPGSVWFSWPGKNPGICILTSSGWAHTGLHTALSQGPRLYMEASGSLAPDRVTSLLQLQPLAFLSTCVWQAGRGSQSHSTDGQTEAQKRG